MKNNWEKRIKYLIKNKVEFLDWEAELLKEITQVEQEAYERGIAEAYHRKPFQSNLKESENS